MDLNELRIHATKLPLDPGVYLMKDKYGTVIYVGKAKKLRNRVSQYFYDTSSHSPKTRMMVSKVDTFEVIIAASEFEALVLECSLIKRYMPKYNILLKDGKGYPYIRIDMHEEYPSLSVVNTVKDDGAEYFGPFGSRSVTIELADAICSILKLPRCNKQFPQDLGKDRHCLHYHMNQCAGWCQFIGCSEKYRALVEHARQLLKGNYKQLTAQLKKKMVQAADALNFELAAILRDQLNAIESLGKQQLVITGKLPDTDVVGYAQDQNKACFTVLHFKNGDLIDKDYEILNITDEAESFVSSLLKQYYSGKGFAPKQIFLPFSIEDAPLLQKLLENINNKKVSIIVPQIGKNQKLIHLANKNALEEIQRTATTHEKIKGSLLSLGNMLQVHPPRRIEAYDVSNISGSDTVASMVVFIDGKPRKSEYRHFKIDGINKQDDYASMQQVVYRRFRRFLDGDVGFREPPDIILIDGGAEHVVTAMKALDALNLQFPVFGMVKDDRHRTRTLVTCNGQQIGIETQQNVFSLIGTIQEETHNFAISYHRKLRSKRLYYSELDKIPGVGKIRKEELLKHFKSLTAIKMASVSELERVVPKNVAYSIYQHFAEKEG